MYKIIKKFLFDTNLNFVKTCNLIKNGEIEEAMLFVNNGVDIHRKNNLLLFLASEKNEKEMMKFIISQYKKINKINIGRVLNELVRSNQLDMIEYLVAHKANINLQCPVRLESPYEIAVQNKNLIILKYLFEHSTPEEKTIKLCFYNAVANDDNDIITYLIFEKYIIRTPELLDTLETLNKSRMFNLDYLEKLNRLFDRKELHNKLGEELTCNSVTIKKRAKL